MASHDYFQDDRQRLDASSTPAQSYDARHVPSSPSFMEHPTPASSYPPSYHPNSNFPASNQAYMASPYSTPSQHNPQPGGQNPFDSVFDDNMYPTESRQHLVPSPGPVFNGAQDTSYHGYSGQVPLQGPYGTEDIPMRDHPGKSPGFGEEEDHVYDDPNGQKRNRKRKTRKIEAGELGMFGSNRKRIPWVVYIMTAAQIGVFIGEIVKNVMLTKSPIMIHPSFNPMIGPSSQVLINMGARYVPCMHNVEGIQDSTIEVNFLCPNATKNDQFCPLSEVCGFGGVPNPVFDGKFSEKSYPDQWWRFIVPIFMHAGLIHIGFNLLLQMTLGKEMEMAIGSIRFGLVYFSSGIFGFVMGGNFAAPGIASTGASGCLFGILALNLLDLLYSWKERRNPVKDLLMVLVEMVISFVLGLLPGLDNFSHIGGFLMGLALGVCVLHSPNALRRRLGEVPVYSSVPPGGEAGGPAFHKNPVSFFQGRKPLWWAWWLVRAALLVLVIVIFIVLLNNFYNHHTTCHWCKYLSCLPVNGWCDLGTIQQTKSS